MVLEAPFSSAVDVAASAYPFVPVRWLMKDQFRSDRRIGKVKASRGKVGVQSEVKRAVVTLVEGHTIDVTTGL